MPAWEFATATRIIFGTGAARDAARLAREFGRTPLVIAGSEPSRVEWLVEALQALGTTCTLLCVSGEPDAAFATGGADLARRHGTDVVIATGGGSAIDAGKAIAALATNPGDALDYLEVVGRGKPLQQASLPFIAMPTTAGTGSEVTRNAVLAVPAQRVKVSLRSPLMLPRLAIVDPRLTYDVPAPVTAATGLDALTQLIEPFLSVRATPMTDALCRDGIPRVARSLRRAVVDGQDEAAREDMALASLLGGLALANAGLGAVHGFAAPIGGMFKAPHGAVCAALLPHVMAANVRALRARATTAPALDRAEEVGRLLTGRSDADADAAVEWLDGIVAALAIPRLSACGITPADVPAIVDQAGRASSMKGNPVVLTAEELTAIVAAAL
ncbi:MAG: iron-containing alcohol dehydrogenase [Acidobacteria bacterium]|nr:iron-containing alcohol dehydrogenase [Acidobacteriota bacterium]